MIVNSVLVLLGLILGGILLFIALLSLSLSYKRERRNQIDKQRREVIRNAVLEGVSTGEIEELTNLHKNESTELTEEVIFGYLKKVSGQDKEKMKWICSELGLIEQEMTRLESMDIYTVLRALNRLTLLEEDIEVQRIVELCREDKRKRAMGARLLLENGKDREATNLILDYSNDYLSVYSMDVLYDASESDCRYLNKKCMELQENWSDTIRLQVLVVLSKCSPKLDAKNLGWIVENLYHNIDDVKVAAMKVLCQHAWESEELQLMGFEYLMDEKPNVRKEAYRLMGTCGGKDVLEVLLEHAIREKNDRCRVVATESLMKNQSTLDIDIPSELNEEAQWITGIKGAQL